MTLAIDLPAALIEQIEARQISDKEIAAVAIAAVELWLAQPSSEQSAAGRFTGSAATFTHRLIAQNRQLFEELAQR